jgi:PqqD family protein of HPr-rel-A system
MAPPLYHADLKGARKVAMEGLTLLFHPGSGMTHILAPPSPEILALLEEEPAAASGLLARLSERYALDGAEDSAIQARLDELEAAGLVRRA